MVTVGLGKNESIAEDFSISIVDKSLDGILGMLFVHRITEFSFVVFSSYLPPENSPWGRNGTAFFSHLLAQTYLYDDVDNIFMCGDVNARTGSLPDLVTDVDDVSPRDNIDTVINAHGRSFVEFLQEAKMCVVNGRVTLQHNGMTSIFGRGVAVVLCRPFGPKNN